MSRQSKQRVVNIFFPAHPGDCALGRMIEVDVHILTKTSHSLPALKARRSLLRRIDIMYNDRLDGRITIEEYDEIYTSFRGKIDEIDNRLKNLQSTEDEFYLTTTYLFELVNNAYDLFIGSEMEQKRQLFVLTLQNLVLDDRKV